MDPTQGPVAPANTSPAKISIPRILGVESPKDISYEDIVAARVFQKTLRAQGYVFGLILLLLGYVGFDLKAKSTELKHQQDDLSAAQRTLHLNIDSVQTRMALDEQQLRARIDSARGTIEAAGRVMESSSAYQNALAAHLVSVGQTQQTTEQLQTQSKRASDELSNGLATLTQAISNLQSQRQQDSASFNRLQREWSNQVSSSLQYVRTVADGLSNTWVQLVEEDTPTPVGASGFSFEFREITRNERAVTSISLRDPEGHEIGSWRALEFQRPITFESGGTRYQLTILQGESQSKLAVLDQDRVVVQIERLPESSEGRNQREPTRTAVPLDLRTAPSGAQHTGSN